MNHILRIGLTGGIGSGKSTVCKFFSELGVPVIDTDLIAHKLLMPDAAAYSSVLQIFGQDIIMDNGEIDRSILRKIVFDDAKSRRKLEMIMHPLIFTEIEKQISLLNQSYCIISIPLLIETNASDKFDRILVVDVSEEKQIERACKRDGSTKDAIFKIIQSQVSRQERLKVADDVISNDGDIDTLRENVFLMHEKYKNLANETHIN